MYPFRIFILVSVISASVYCAQSETLEAVLKGERSETLEKPSCTEGLASAEVSGPNHPVKPNPASPSNSQGEKVALEAWGKDDTSVAPKKEQHDENDEVHSASPSNPQGEKLDLEASGKVETSATPENEQHDENDEVHSASPSNPQGKKLDLEASGKADTSATPENEQDGEKNELKSASPASSRGKRRKFDELGENHTGLAPQLKKYDENGKLNTEYFEVKQQVDGEVIQMTSFFHRIEQRRKRDASKGYLSRHAQEQVQGNV